jgi:hypothetical protein
MGLLASVLAFIFFLAASIVMVAEPGDGTDIGLLSTNLPSTAFGALGFLVLAGTVFATRNKAR